MTDMAQVFRLLAALADDLEALASLHDREVDDALLAHLRAVEFPDFGLQLRGDAALEAQTEMRAALADLPTPLAPKVRDHLAADFAAIYLNHSISASPCESVWLDEENLAMQAPMFAVREIYRRYDMEAPDWRTRPDDHLCHELGFLACLARREDVAALREMCDFMDAHLMLWLPRFASRVFARCESRFHAAAAVLTLAYCEELRSLLAELMNIPRRAAEDFLPPQQDKASQQTPLRYMPGMAPSW